MSESNTNDLFSQRISPPTLNPFSSNFVIKEDHGNQHLELMYMLTSMRDSQKKNAEETNKIINDMAVQQEKNDA